MLIYFRSRQIQRICSEKKHMIKKQGPREAKILQRRMLELQSADSLQDIFNLPAARLHQLTNERKAQWSVDLVHPHRLLFLLDEEPIPHNENGSIDFSKIKRIKIIEIADTH